MLNENQIQNLSINNIGKIMDNENLIKMQYPKNIKKLEKLIYFFQQ